MNELSDRDEVVICVHGTFANDKKQNDTGHRWWQRDSAAWQRISSQLPKGVSLPGGDQKLFHWSGANSQAERLKAANRLLALLLELESQGRRYHLVGHSHGGSVIWEALITAELMRSNKTVYSAVRPHLRRHGLLPPLRQSVSRNYRGRRKALKDSSVASKHYSRLGTAPELAGLRSWVTVGTPFFQYLPQKRPTRTGWPSRRADRRGVGRRLREPARHRQSSGSPGACGASRRRAVR